MDRSQKIIRISYQAILVNLFLVVSKIIVAIFSNSLAIFLDAINNLSDGLSSIIIIIGTKLSKKPRDKKHPYGFGRIEYLSTLILALIILFTGYQALMESLDKIFHPGTPDYSWPIFAVLAIAVVTKYFFGQYLKRQGTKLNALSLEAAGSDAVMDSFISASTIFSALVYILSGINLDGWIGALIAFFIIKTGLEILKEGTSSIIGNRLDSELSSNIIHTIEKVKGVLGAYDLIIHEYGPDTMIGSVHIEVNEGMHARQIDQISRNITALIHREYSVLLTVGIYASNTSGKQYALEKEIRSFVLSQPHILQLHGFYLDEAKKLISFDLVYDADLKDPEQKAHLLENELKEKFSPYRFHIVMDYDYSLSS